MFVCRPEQLQQHCRVSPSKDNDNAIDYVQDQGQCSSFSVVIQSDEHKEETASGFLYLAHGLGTITSQAIHV